MNEPDEIDTETPVDSLHDDLKAAFDTETSVDSGETADAAAQVSPQGTASGEASKAIQALEPPKHWSDPDKALFGKSPRELQQSWLDREKRGQQHWDSRFQEVAGWRRDKDSWDEVFKPFARDFELNGISSLDFTKRMVGVHNGLRDDFPGTLRWLATQYGFDLSKLNEPAQQSDPQLDKLTQTLTGLESRINGFASAQAKADREAMVGKVESFAMAKDDKGQLLHPHFDEVVQDVLAVIRAQPDGKKDIEAAYKKAVRMNDAVWEKVSAAKATEAETERKRKQMEEINKAKRAGVTSESRETKNGSGRPTTLKEDLSAGFANWQG